MRRALILVGIAGCFDPSVQPGAPCGENGACPGTLACMNGTCERAANGTPDANVDSNDGALPDDAMIEPDAPMFDAGPMDNDGDGVANASDNCPQMANNDQHDEDNDAVGDVCDNCPHVANANQAAVMDNDSVGDACDPYPTTGGDSIVRFLPMHVVPPMVTTTGGWTQMGDAYVHPNNGDSALIVQGGPWTNPTIVVSAKQEANLVPLVRIAATVGEAAAGYVHCGYEDEGDTSDYHRAVWGTGVGVAWDFWGAIDHYNPARLTGNFTIRVRGNAQDDNIDCTVNDGRGTVNTGTVSVNPLSPGNVGIRSDGITYSVNYIVVFNR
ncbi:MAG: thrombospondin type 3 repeat-containing protein [Kofleriaceae bacterium]